MNITSFLSKTLSLFSSLNRTRLVDSSEAATITDGAAGAVGLSSPHDNLCFRELVLVSFELPLLLLPLLLALFDAAAT